MNRANRRRNAKLEKTSGTARDRVIDLLLRDGSRHHAAGALDDADACYRKVLAKDPQNANALHLSGVVASQRGDHTSAEALISRAIEFAPNIGSFHNNLGLALEYQGKLVDAIAAFSSAIDLDPRDVLALDNLGHLLLGRNRIDDAIALHRRALAIDPNDANAWSGLGDAFQRTARYDDAIAAYVKAIEANPRSIAALNNLGALLHRKNDTTTAIALYRRVLALAPTHADTLNNLGNALVARGEAHAALEVYRAALASNSGRKAIHGNLLMALNYVSEISPRDLFAEHTAFGKRHEDASTPVPFAHEPRARRRLKVGYISPDFRRHSVAFFFLPLLLEHDRAKFEIHCYASVQRPDEVTDEIRAASEHWREIVGLSDTEAAELISHDGIDILVDLAGHTEGNRLSVFAKRLAPIQATWLGYPCTTGLSTIDYRITDVIADPAGDADLLHTETLVRLATGFSCYAPPPASPIVGVLPATVNGYITFGSFNNIAKITPEVVLTWARILERVPGSKILLKSKHLECTDVAERYRTLFSRVGIAADRVATSAWLEANESHLELYNRVDIALDPFPYNGATTTCEALWMGVPVVSLAGDRHASRVGASVLSRVDLAELVAKNVDDYVEVAVGLARNLEQLAGLRSSLRDRMRASPLCDARAFARAIEHAFVQMWDGRASDRGSLGFDP